MSIKIKFLIYFGIIIATVTIVGGYSIWGTGVIRNYLNTELPNAIKEVEVASKLNVTAQLIRYDDEVLTMSARNYAYTGNKSWKIRYDEYSPKLDSRILEAISSSNQDEKAIFDNINIANSKLVQLEKQAINHVDNGNLAEAIAILNSVEYGQFKSEFQAGIIKFLSNRNSELDSASAVSADLLNYVKSYLQLLARIQSFSLMGFVSLFYLVILFLLWQIYQTFIVPLETFRKAAKEITKGEYNKKVNLSGNNEITDFANDFNTMTESLRSSIEKTENEVRSRTEELEKINKFLTGREIKMSELKKEIEKYKAMHEKG